MNNPVLSHPVESSLHYAGFWRRIQAALIDSVILFVLMALVFGSAYFKADILSAKWLLSTFITIAIIVMLWVRFSGTPGKLLLGCQIVDAMSLKPIGIKQALVRYFSYCVSMLPLFLGFFWVGFDKKKQGFHDKIANTFVLHNSRFDPDDESQKSLTQLLSELR